MMTERQAVVCEPPEGHEFRVVPQDCQELFEHVNTLLENKGEFLGHLAPNGEPFIVFTIGGIKPELAPFPIGADTRREAITRWLEELYAFVRGKNARQIYWRDRPEFIEHEKGPNAYKRFVTVRARLVLA